MVAMSSRGRSHALLKCIRLWSFILNSAWQRTIQFCGSAGVVMVCEVGLGKVLRGLEAEVVPHTVLL